MSEKPPMAQFSPQRAALMALSVAHQLGDANADALNDFIATQAAFAAPGDIARAQEMARDIAQDIATAPDGVDTLLNLLAAALRGDATATAYSLCADFIALHGRVSPEEMRFLERLGDALGIDRLSRAAFDRAAQARATPLSAADEQND
ncbi:MAG: hypothetical protein L7U45_03485 [Alphaproteobacteria bacterium]|nr:hypothetical protein [Alphaproteobacteria bacterium]